MSLENIDNNQELVNAYKNYKKKHEQLLLLPKQHQKEIQLCEQDLLKLINDLQKNENFENIASEEEKRKIQELNNTLESTLPLT